MKHYHYIITGGGAAGLLLAYRMATDPFFDNMPILLLDKELKTSNDRTWCFWEEPNGVFDHLLFKTWGYAMYKDDSAFMQFPMDPYRYKMLRSADFYRFMYEKLAEKPHIERRIDRVISINDTGERVEVVTETGIYTCEKVFNSIFHEDLLHRQSYYPVLQQHFIGWFIKTERAFFDDEVFTFMDFEVPQEESTRFVYVLPFSEKEALVEYTVFSETLLPDEVYEKALRDYVAKKLGIKVYKIMEKEKGSIPMTAYPFARHNTANVLHIGTAGGWTKPSTGYTFLNTVRETEVLTARLKQSLPLSKRTFKKRFRWYDRLFIDVLYRHNELGSKLFSDMFTKNPPEKIFKFLGEKTTFWEELDILLSLPALPFLKSMLRFRPRLPKRENPSVFKIGRHF